MNCQLFRITRLELSTNLSVVRDDPLEEVDASGSRAGLRVAKN